eukprot:CAMPEP_0202892634 /NCGR_PEP_ID=MMETSP1392-20130828/2348_1 /ASSEMBLY_ACC=CAM_ASM_000868 /TAXON_ID=225041 /ORGANISM="Chlamydomonas chlamydogama, Strain SAG 11-48b" /LENGTH=224 /DNA_ID=CAMNT_0049576667 /DNA_START=116 /DNA_END=787 /DNA_ORIENTATION=-
MAASRYPGSLVAAHAKAQVLLWYHNWKASRPPSEPSRAAQFFLRHEGAILAGVFIAWMLKIAVSTYMGERFGESIRKQAWVDYYDGHCKMSRDKLRELDETYRFYLEAQKHSKQKMQVAKLYRQLLELQAGQLTSQDIDANNVETSLLSEQIPLTTVAQVVEQPAATSTTLWGKVRSWWAGRHGGDHSKCWHHVWHDSYMHHQAVHTASTAKIQELRAEYDREW